MHQCFKCVGDDDVVRTVFAKIQPFKGVENYFIDSLLYKESNKGMKKSLPDNIDSGNKADSKSEKDVSATLILEPIVEYLDNLDYNNPAKNEGEWVLSENVAFDYSLCLEDVFKSVNISLVHMPLTISKMACMHIEDNEGSAFIVPPLKKDQCQS